MHKILLKTPFNVLKMMKMKKKLNQKSKRKGKETHIKLDFEIYEEFIELTIHTSYCMVYRVMDLPWRSEAIDDFYYNILLRPIFI